MIINKNSNNKGHMVILLYLYLKLLLLLITCSFILTSCNTTRKPNEEKEHTYLTKSSFLLNTMVSIYLYDKQEESILNDCFDLIAKYEDIYSRTNPSSELYHINSGEAPNYNMTFPITEELSNLLAYGLYYSKLSNGAFDITIAPITSIWNFREINPVIPTEVDITNALEYVNYKNIIQNGRTLTFMKEGMSIDFGAIAKGYIADQVKEFLVSKGVESALINLGGNVLCIGQKPDGTNFKVGIQKPFADRNETIAIMEINNLSVVSSGIYERFFTMKDKTYHHILDPFTGHPVDNNLVSVTIISKKSVDGDGLSTSCFALGLEKGMKLIESLPDTYAVFITKDYEVHYTKDFKDAIKVIKQ